jgi:hypothetical protein
MINEYHRLFYVEMHNCVSRMKVNHTNPLCIFGDAIMRFYEALYCSANSFAKSARLTLPDVVGLCLS